MAYQLLSERELEFVLYELFDAENLSSRPRYTDHSKETYTAAIRTARSVAERHLLPIRRDVDAYQPVFDGKKVTAHPRIKPALEAMVATGLHATVEDYELGGMQLPPIVASAVSAYLVAGGNSITGYHALTNASANLLNRYGSSEQISRWVEPMRSGRFLGTMAMTEPEAGSSLADLTTKAIQASDGTYRITGNKIFISGGDHELTENIIHLVLARTSNAPAGVKGISLFIVPKYLVDQDGAIGACNDVALAGVFHKMGGHGQTSTALNFGENGGAIGYLVGEENRGLEYMFHMMDEARIMVGTGAAVIALTGYQYSLQYALERAQGRPVSSKASNAPPVSIIKHADVRRMLLAQKAYSEGAYALCSLGHQLSDDRTTAPSEAQRESAKLLIDLLTPIIKTWPSEYGTRANSLAIQVLGGHGYIQEHPVEMFYRDNRLNPIHEGTTGIQSLDLLARKIPRNNMASFRALTAEIDLTIDEARKVSSLVRYADELEQSIAWLETATNVLVKAMSAEPIDLVLSNSVKYLDLIGHVVVAWIWLKQGIISECALQSQCSKTDEKFYLGKLQTMRYFFKFELSKTENWASIQTELDNTCYSMDPEWF